MKNIYFIFIFLVLLNACASLSKTQISSVKKYAETTRNYSVFPGILVNDYINLQNQIFLMRSPLITNPEKAVNLIYNNQQMLIKSKKEAEKMDLSFRIIRCYAANLELLATTDYNKDISYSAESLKTNLDTLIGSYNSKFNKNLPKVGNLVFKAITYLGQKYVEKERAKTIKLYVEKGNNIICEMSNTTKEFIENTVMNAWLPDLDQQVKANHLALRKQIIKDTLNYSVNIISLKEIDNDAILLYQEIEYLNNLSSTMINSLESICKAHKSLSENMKEKKKLDDIISEFKDFYFSVEELNNIYKSYKAN
jgi:hypothetical protein